VTRAPGFLASLLATAHGSTAKELAPSPMPLAHMAIDQHRRERLPERTVAALIPMPDPPFALADVGLRSSAEPPPTPI